MSTILIRAYNYILQRTASFKEMYVKSSPSLIGVVEAKRVGETSVCVAARDFTTTLNIYMHRLRTPPQLRAKCAPFLNLMAFISLFE